MRYIFNDVAARKDHKLAKLLPPRSSRRRQLRNIKVFDAPVYKTDRVKNSFIISHSSGYNM